MATHPKIGVNPSPHNVQVRGFWHFTECMVAAFPDLYDDQDCTCHDDSPEWTI